MSKLIVAALALVAGARVAEAQRVEFVTRIVASEVGLQRAPLGDPNLVAMSQLDYRGSDATIEVLDIAAARVSKLTMKRAALVRAFGRPEPALGLRVAPQGELVALRKGRAGVLLRDGVGMDAARHWYAEVDAATGALGRSAPIGTLGADEHLTFLGTDGARDAAWFAVHRRTAAKVVVDFQRLDLASLALTTPMSLATAPKTAQTGYEDIVMIHAAPDFARFAVVEYDELGLGTAPLAQVHFIDGRGSFAVPAMPTTYGVAFSRDGAYAYLGSSELGTVERVDLAARRVDARTTGPRLLGHLVLSPKGKLIALATSASYAVYDPALAARTDRAHDPDLAAAARELFGGAAITADGRHAVFLEAPPPLLPGILTPPGRAYVIARIVD